MTDFSAPSAAATRRASLPRDLALIAVFAALIAALTAAPAVPVGPVGVPVTLQTLGIALTALLLGAWLGTAATLVYVAVGLAGLPVFARFSGGLGVLASPSAGYLLSFPLTACVIGALSTLVLRRVRRARGVWLFGCVVVGFLGVNHPLGILGMMVNAHLSFQAALLADLVYVPGDLLKAALAAAVAAGVLRAFPSLAARRTAAL